MIVIYRQNLYLKGLNYAGLSHSSGILSLKLYRKAVPVQRLMQPSCGPSKKCVYTLVFWATKMRGAGASLMEQLGELEDPRQPSNGTRHDFREILVIAVCAMLSNAALSRAQERHSVAGHLSARVPGVRSEAVRGRVSALGR